MSHWRDWLNHALDCEDESLMTPWEVDFAESIARQAAPSKDWEPTRKQLNVLRRIDDKVCGNDGYMDCSVADLY